MLAQMFELRKDYIYALAKARPAAALPDPVDLSSKDGQRQIRDLALRGVEEVFEALGLLRNTKVHRATEIPDFDREHFLEEWVDAFNFFFSVLIKAGYTPQELFDMYAKKDAIIHERLRNGY